MTLEKIIPKYARIPLLIVVVYDFSVYSGTRMIAGGWHHYKLGFEFEDKIPLLPWTIIIYLGCYAFWIINYIIATQESKETAYRFALADLLGKSVCLFFYIFFPTTMQRPEIYGNSIWENLLKFLYNIDAADNLFPSIHCFVSWLCFIGVRRKQRIPAWYQIVSCIIALAVCVSTLTLKQHVIIDVFAGVFLAELCYYISGKFS